MNRADTSQITPLRGISSMATRQLLAEMAAGRASTGRTPLTLESVGGVDAARRVREGEAFDLVFLASDAIAKLAASGHVLPASQVNLVRSQFAVAVKAGATAPDISTEAGVRQVVLQAATIGYSTGPSGTSLLALFERWGILRDVQPKLRQAPAGVPVAAMVASGDAALGFQQRSEMVDESGIQVIGSLPAEIAIATIFSGAVCAVSLRANEARAVLADFASADRDEVKRRNGMAPF